jgi:hypothetical protein
MKTSTDKRRLTVTAFATVASFGLASLGLAAIAAPFQLNAESQSFINNPPPMQSTSYPAMTMQGGAQQAATYDNHPTYSGQAQQQAPLQAQVQKQVALPPQFLGRWQVSGQLGNIEAQPQFQAGVGKLFQGQTQNVWNITGTPGNYTMSTDQGVSTALNIWKATKDTAMIRYRHPTYNVTSEEAIVLQLQNGGATFQGLERISIVKDGQQPPRAKVTYQLFGQRQR